MKKLLLLLIPLVLLSGCVSNQSDIDHYTNGQNYLNSLEYTKALSEFTLGLNNDKNDLKYYLAIADIYSKKGRLNDSISILEEGNSATNSKEIKIALGDLHRLNGEFEESLKYFDELLSTEGEEYNVKARMGRVKTLIMLQKYDDLKLEKDYIDKISLDSEYLIMMSVLSIDEPEEAVNLLLKSTNIENANLELTKELRMAYAGFEKSQNIHNLSQIAYVLLNYNWYEIAHFPVDKLLQENEFFETGYIYKGLINIHVNRLSEAESSLIKSLEINPSNTDAKIFLTQVKFLLNADDQALEIITEIINDPESLLNLQQYLAIQEILYKQDQNDLIIELYDRFSDSVIVPDSKNLIYPEILIEVGKYNQAELFLHSINQDESGLSKSENAKFKALLATAYYNNNKKQDALKLINEAENTDNKNSTVYYLKGLILKSEGQIEQANLAFERAKELDLTGKITEQIENHVK